MLVEYNFPDHEVKAVEKHDDVIYLWHTTKSIAIVVKIYNRLQTISSVYFIAFL